MSRRARHYVMLAVCVVCAFAYTRMTRVWSDVAFYAGGAALIAVLGTVGNLWVDLARDGSLRRRPGDRPAVD